MFAKVQNQSYNSIIPLTNSCEMYVKINRRRQLYFQCNFMAHSAVWGYLPVQRQNTNSKKLTIEKLSKSGLRRFIKFGQPHSNDERKIILLLNLHFTLDLRI